MLELYVYNTETNEVVAIITGENNEKCESKMVELNYDDTDYYGGTYSPAFGMIDGLTMTQDCEHHDA